MSPEFKCGDIILKLDLGDPSEYAKEKAIKELRETPENIKNGLEELKRLLKEETTLFVPIENDEWLLIYLRVCKFYPDGARDLVKRYYNLSLKYSEVKERLIPRKLKQVFDDNLVSILPQRDQCGRRIIITLIGKTWNHKVVHKDDLFSASTLCTDAVQMEPETQINGVVYLLDFQGLSFFQSLQFTPSYIKRLVDYVQGNVALRIKGFHLINAPAVVGPLFSAAKPFFTQKYNKRILMHSNFESLHQHLSPECLPERYGGTLKQDVIYGRETYEICLYHEKYFEDKQKYGYNKIKL